MHYIVIAYLLLALWLYRYFAKRDRGDGEPRRALRIACWSGVISVFFAGVLNSIFIPDEVIALLDSDNAIIPPYETLLSAGLMVGLIEELLKFLPLALFLYRKPFFNETTDGVIYFSLAGMWFGTIESISYAFNYGADVGLMRLIVAPFLHAGFSALAGVGLARTKITGNPIYLMFGLSLAIVLHGLYDFMLFTQIPLLSLAALGLGFAVNLAPFRHFKNARLADEKIGLSKPHDA